MERFAVQQDPVFRLAVIAQPFAVVRHDCDNRAVEPSARLQTIEQPADQFIGVGDLAVVGLRHSMRCRRRVRRMRLVEVKKREHLRVGLTIEPGAERVDGEAAVALRVGQRFTTPCHLDRIVEEVEPVGDARLMPQNVRRHGGARRVAAGFEARRERAAGGLQRVPDVVANAVVSGKESGHQRCVRRQRQRAMAVHIVEHDRVAAKSIQHRRRSVSVSVERQTIGAQRVDGDQNDRRAAVLRAERAGLLARAAELGRKKQTLSKERRRRDVDRNTSIMRKPERSWLSSDRSWVLHP